MLTYLEIKKPNIDFTEMDNFDDEALEISNRNLFQKISQMADKIKEKLISVKQLRNDRRDRYIHPDNSENPEIKSKRGVLKTLYNQIMTKEKELKHIRSKYEHKINKSDQVLTGIQHQKKTKEKLENYFKNVDHQMDDMREVKRGLIKQKYTQKEEIKIETDPEISERIQKMNIKEIEEK
mmetsp:Transcript_7016/g.6199  ORF Transcript_7016/g.6199 Transcript_7016/m.6199 type:complete len:180 (+) Transcript_7016:636-1175(+)